MNGSESSETPHLSRRNFLQAAGGAAAGLSVPSAGLRPRLVEDGGDTQVAGDSAPSAGPPKDPAIVRGAFIYPPTASLEQEGYYSWPGSGFDAEGRQKQYTQRIAKIGKDLRMSITVDEQPLDDAQSVARFIEEVKQSQPDGLLLVVFKKGHFEHAMRIVEETKVPTVVLATLGILLVDHISQVHRKPGVYLINSLDNLDAVEQGMKMIRTARRMKDGLIARIGSSQVEETTVPHLGTRVRTVPHERFYEEFARTQATGEVKKLANAYLKNARKVVQPTREDILDAARAYFALRRIVEAEKADAIMMDCLPGLSKPHKHCPPCMGVMSLRDEGIPAGCQADLNATLTLMLVQELFERPGFQQNASMDTEKNHYFGAHCTCPTRLSGPKGPAEPYILMSHAEAGWGCVPRVLWRAGQDVTLAQYLSGQKPRMHIYSGKVVGCPPIPPTGGCRTNIEMTINEVDDVCDVKGMHQVIFYGNYAKPLRTFCQLYGIEVVT